MLHTCRNAQLPSSVRATPPMLHHQSFPSIQNNVTSATLTHFTTGHAAPQSPPAHLSTTTATNNTTTVVATPTAVDLLSPLRVVSRRAVDPYEVCRSQLDHFVELQSEQIELVRHLLHSLSSSSTDSEAARGEGPAHRDSSGTRNTPEDLGAVTRSAALGAGESSAAALVRRLHIMQREAAQLAELHCLPALKRLLSTFVAYWSWKQEHMVDESGDDGEGQGPLRAVDESVDTDQSNRARNDGASHQQQEERRASASPASGMANMNASYKKAPSSLRQRYDRVVRVKDELECFLQLESDAVESLEPHLRLWVQRQQDDTTTERGRSYRDEKGVVATVAAAATTTTTTLPTVMPSASTNASALKADRHALPMEQFTRFVRELLEVTQTTHHVAQLLVSALEALCRPSQERSTASAGLQQRSASAANTIHAQSRDVKTTAAGLAVVPVTTRNAAERRQHTAEGSRSPSHSPSPSATPSQQRMVRVPKAVDAKTTAHHGSGSGTVIPAGDRKIQEAEEEEELWEGVLSPLTPQPKTPPSASTSAAPVVVVVDMAPSPPSASHSTSTEQHRYSNKSGRAEGEEGEEEDGEEREVSASPFPESPAPRRTPPLSRSKPKTNEAQHRRHPHHASSSLTHPPSLSSIDSKQESPYVNSNGAGRDARSVSRSVASFATASLSPSAVSLSPLTVQRHGGAVNDDHDRGSAGGSSSRATHRSSVSPPRLSSTSASPSPTPSGGNRRHLSRGESAGVGSAAVSPSAMRSAVRDVAAAPTVHGDHKHRHSGGRQRRTVGADVVEGAMPRGGRAGEGRSLLSELTASAQPEEEAAEVVFVPAAGTHTFSAAADTTAAVDASASVSRLGAALWTRHGQLDAVNANYQSDDHGDDEGALSRSRSESIHAHVYSEARAFSLDAPGEADMQAGSVGRAASIPHSVWPQLRALSPSIVAEEEQHEGEGVVAEACVGDSSRPHDGRSGVSMTAELKSGASPSVSAAVKQQGEAVVDTFYTSSAKLEDTEQPRPPPPGSHSRTSAPTRSPSPTFSSEAHAYSSTTTTAAGAQVPVATTALQPDLEEEKKLSDTANDSSFRVEELEQQAREMEARLQRLAEEDTHTQTQRAREQIRNHMRRRDGGRRGAPSLRTASSSSSSSSSTDSDSSLSDSPRRRHHHRSQHHHRQSRGSRSVSSRRSRSRGRRVEQMVHRELEVLRAEQQRSLEQMQRAMRSALDEVVSVAASMASSRASSRHSEACAGVPHTGSSSGVPTLDRGDSEAETAAKRDVHDGSHDHPKRSPQQQQQQQQCTPTLRHTPAPTVDHDKAAKEGDEDEDAAEVEQVKLRKTLAATQAKADRLEQANIQLKKRLWLAELSGGAEKPPAPAPPVPSSSRTRHMTLRDAFVFGSSAERNAQRNHRGDSRETIQIDEDAECFAGDADTSEGAGEATSDRAWDLDASVEERAMLYLVDRALAQGQTRQRSTTASPRLQGSEAKGVTAKRTASAPTRRALRGHSDTVHAASPSSSHVATADGMTTPPQPSRASARVGGSSPSSPEELQCFDVVNGVNERLSSSWRLHPDAFLPFSGVASVTAGTLGRSPRIRQQRESIFQRLRRASTLGSVVGEKATGSADEGNGQADVGQAAGRGGEVALDHQHQQQQVPLCSASQLAPPPPFQPLAAQQSHVTVPASGKATEASASLPTDAQAHPYHQSRHIISSSSPSPSSGHRGNQGGAVGLDAAQQSQGSRYGGGGASHYYVSISSSAPGTRDYHEQSHPSLSAGEGISGSALRAEHVLQNARRLLQSRRAACRSEEDSSAVGDGGRLNDTTYYARPSYAAVSGGETYPPHLPYPGTPPPPYATVVGAPPYRGAAYQGGAVHPTAVQESAPYNWATQHRAVSAPQRAGSPSTHPVGSPPHRPVARVPTAAAGCFESPSAVGPYYRYDTSPCSAVAYSESKMPHASPQRVHDLRSHQQSSQGGGRRKESSTSPIKPTLSAPFLVERQDGARPMSARVLPERVSSATSPIPSPVSTRQRSHSSSSSGAALHRAAGQADVELSTVPPSGRGGRYVSYADGAHGRRGGGVSARSTSASRQVRWEDEAAQSADSSPPPPPPPPPSSGFHSTTSQHSSRAASSASSSSSRGTARGEMLGTLAHQEERLQRALDELHRQQEELLEKRHQVSQLTRGEEHSAAGGRGGKKFASASSFLSSAARGGRAGSTATRAESARSDGASQAKAVALLHRLDKAEAVLAERERRLRQAVGVVQRQRAALEDDSFL